MNQRKASFLPAHTEKQVSSLTPSSKSSYRRRHPWKEIMPAVKGQKCPKWTGLWSENLKYLWTQRKNTEKIKLKKNKESWFVCWFHYKIEAPAVTLGPIWTPNQTSGFEVNKGCMSLISWQSLLCWPTFQRWTRILFILCFTLSSHQLIILPADKFQYLQDYTFQLWIWIHNLHNLKTKWNIWNQDWIGKKQIKDIQP